VERNVADLTRKATLFVKSCAAICDRSRAFDSLDIDSATADAVFEHGVLTLTLPTAETAKPKTIKVQAKPLIEAKAS
jgi:hypothetical protein